MATKRKKKPSPVGRPTKYNSDFIEQAKKLTILGATDVQVADFFNVTEATITGWKKKYPKFFTSLKEGKVVADNQVKKALFERATGYEHPDTHISNYMGDITQTEITKHYPPDVTACIFWLHNRDPENWRREPRPDTQHGESPGLNITFSVKEAVNDIKITNAKP